MANYPLTKLNKEGTLLRPQRSYYSDEYAQAMCDLYLSDEIIRDEKDNTHTRYRLHAKQPHNIEMALAYDLMCPKCSGHLKQVGRTLTAHELGQYACPGCDKR